MLSAFLSTLSATGKLFLFSLLGYIIFKQKILNKYYKYFLDYIIYAGLPLLILERFITTLNYKLLIQIFPVSFFGLFIILFFLFSGKFFAKHILKIKKNLIPAFLVLFAFNNHGYLPIPLFEFILPPAEAKIAHIYIFFIVIPFNLIFWSYGVHLIKKKDTKIETKQRIPVTPPTIAIIAGILLALLNTKAVIPKSIFKIWHFHSELMNYFILIVLGGGLSQYSIRMIKIDRVVLFIAMFKLICFPLLIGLIIYGLNHYFKFSYLLNLFLIIQAGMPSAGNIIVIVRKWADESILPFVFSTMIFSYAMVVLTVPLLVALVNYFFL